ncbi:MAG: hypothetical protein ABJZ55_06425 [Fuerstiella sp.]
MNLLAVSDDVSALLIVGVGLLASIFAAYLAFQKGAGGKKSLETEAPIVLAVDQTRSPEASAKHAA